ncbi:uncharacterized protein [Lolium perenne]|uniref:uncharacterized protein n=1 Tax=Lolium perenne TaxID=4522 RepID=UPI0021F5CC9F|nr:uncharacterized protein LOC127297624 [Lolium perenne]
MHGSGEQSCRRDVSAWAGQYSRPRKVVHAVGDMVIAAGVETKMPDAVSSPQGMQARQLRSMLRTLHADFRATHKQAILVRCRLTRLLTSATEQPIHDGLIRANLGHIRPTWKAKTSSTMVKKKWPGHVLHWHTDISCAAWLI